MVEAGEATLKEYFERSRKWEQDAYITALRSARVWRTVGLLSLGVSLASVLAIVALLPLKTVEPFVVRVDNATGIVETMSALKDAPNTYEEAVGRYFLGKYVQAREGFLFDERAHNYRVVALMSDAEEQGEFARFYNASNPQSPQNQYGRRISVEIKIRSISFIGESGNVAQVQYIREEKVEQNITRTEWIATMTFQFVTSQISANDRLINPLGFVVTEYRTAEAVS